MDLMFQSLRKYADFNGRARRAEYWLFVLLYSVLFGIPYGAGAAVGEGAPLYLPLALVAMVVALALIIPSLAVAVRRLHDTGRSGWWVLLAFVPLVGLVLLVFYCLPGAKGPNRFGPDPKGDTAEAIPAIG
jgi:uncharacterized membrane protein YhaH (DUF805 family)